jgi:hypothetical protein
MTETGTTGDKRPADLNLPFGEIPNASKKVITAARKIFSGPDSFSDPSSGMSRRRIFDLYLGLEARLGKTIEIAGETRHIKGLYEQFPDLRKRQIDGILNAAILMLADAATPQYVGSLVEGFILTARRKARNHKKK